MDYIPSYPPFVAMLANWLNVMQVQSWTHESTHFNKHILLTLRRSAPTELHSPLTVHLYLSLSLEGNQGLLLVLHP